MEHLNLQISGERSISQKVAETLRKAIFRGDLKLGERLVEANVAKSLNVSITPVRQAFTQLAAEGLIQVVPYKGTNVIQITETFIDEAYSIRLKLELMAAELALPRMTPDDCSLLENYAKQMDRLAWEGSTEPFAEIDIRFHGLFYERAGQGLLLEIWKMIQSRIQLLQSYGRLYHRPEKLGEVEGRHMEIVRAVREGDLPQLIRIMEAHIQRGKTMMMEHFARKS
jgi:DNA-binding GntR family transcriptional regulator